MVASLPYLSSPGNIDKALSGIRSLNETAPMLPRVGEENPLLDLREEQTPFELEQNRDRMSLTVSRMVHDRIFRRIVLRAYSERCAISGLRLINGSGRAEVAAAHIRPVEANGPDIVSNGIALSGTVHWMFDRGIDRSFGRLADFGFTSGQRSR